MSFLILTDTGEVDSDQNYASSQFDALIDMRHSPCDDDCENTAPYIGMMPEESGKEDGSPLRFASEVEFFLIQDCCGM